MSHQCGLDRFEVVLLVVSFVRRVDHVVQAVPLEINFVAVFEPFYRAQRRALDSASERHVFRRVEDAFVRGVVFGDERRWRFHVDRVEGRLSLAAFVPRNAAELAAGLQRSVRDRPFGSCDVVDHVTVSEPEVLHVRRETFIFHAAAQSHLTLLHHGLRRVRQRHVRRWICDYEMFANLPKLAAAHLPTLTSAVLFVHVILTVNY